MNPWIGRLMVTSRLVATGCALLAAAPSVAALEPIEQRYRFAIGQESATVPTGTIWLYQLPHWGGQLERVQIGTIRDGRATVRIAEELLPDGWIHFDPLAAPEGYVIVVELPGLHFYLTQPFDQLDGDQLAWHLQQLGARMMDTNDEDLIVLPALSQRRITFQTDAGQPAVGLEVGVDLFMSDSNHCGVHQGIEVGSFRTDSNGTISFLAPAVPLYVHVEHYELDVAAEDDPVTPAYRVALGFEVPGTPEIVLRRPGWGRDSLPSDHYRLNVRKVDGMPAKALSVVSQERHWEYGAWDGPSGLTNDTGDVELDLTASTVDWILLCPSGGTQADCQQGRRLSNEEMRRLFTTHTLTITLSDNAGSSSDPTKEAACCGS